MQIAWQVFCTKQRWATSDICRIAKLLETHCFAASELMRQCDAVATLGQRTRLWHSVETRFCVYGIFGRVVT